ncbi:conjugal transfer protein TraF [Glaciecola petra]|uniref:Conjugal transfer protein TraF n=1 Tax=Glaciecola petra TaxID=3075602 RepID=A0ABU2ZVT4_9ALTE|nr:conjugal transfer protein TraF [Aestuariibacter sp. P117]MDT0596351.1 conjugal transfer protein TraF [Aestuariibacter sp. P117]
MNHIYPNKLVAGMLGLALVSANVSAQSVFQSTGSGVTRGAVSNSSDLNSLLRNPAAPSYRLGSEEGFSVNILPPIGGGYEVGEIDSLIDELDELIDILEQDDLSAEEALDAKDRFEPFLANAEQDGRIKLAGQAGIPLLPFFYRSTSWGTITFNASVSGSMRTTVLADDIEIIAFNDTFKINTASAVYVKSAGLVTLSVGYSHLLWETENLGLHAGINANVNQYELAKNIISLAGLEDGEDIGDAIQDDYENNALSNTNIAIDVGLLFVSNNANVGLSISDINEPEYDYGSLASTCSNLSGISLDNCFVAQDAIARGRIAANETFIANAQATLEASAWMGEGTRFGFHSSIDLNEKNDPIGDLYQWASVSATADFNNWLIPEFRLGYSKNLAGTELSYYSVGVTFLKHADLDVRWSDESVEIDDSNAPRSAFFSFSIQTKF